MMPRPPHASCRRYFGPATVAVLLALLLASCGRTLPSAPTTRADRPFATLTEADYLEEVAVLPAPGTDVAQLAADYGATLAAGSVNTACVRFVPAAGEEPDALADRLMLDSRVIVAERNAILETAEARQESYASDDGFGSLQAATEQGALRAIGIESAHDVSNGDGIKVAIIDTGVDPAHPLLSPRIAGGVDYVSYDYNPTDVADGLDSDGDGNVDEAWGHGTHVAGLVALAAPGARLLNVRVLDSDGRGNVAAVTAGIRWAIDHGARVINMSLGMLRSSVCIERMLAEAEAAGIVVVSSAGNWGAENPREYPAISPHVIAVAATDTDARPASFTSYGEHVSLGAPGIAVRSAYPGGGWRLWSGTSMSAPLVSGTAALLLAIHRDWNRDAVLGRLSEGARDIHGLSPDQTGKLGVGMLQAGDALRPDYLLPIGDPVNAPPVLRRP